MGAPAPAGAVPVRADVDEFRRLFSRSSLVEAKLKTVLRKNIRKAAYEAADRVRSEAMQPGATVAAANSRTTGLRSGIAAGVQVKIMTGNRAGVAIVASSRAMGTGRESLVRAWEIGGAAARGWRHPVYGQDAWVTQRGHPYFRKTIFNRREQIRAAVESAMTEAAASLKGT